MSEAVVDDIVAVLPPLLQSLEALGFVARHLNPPDFDRVMEKAGSPIGRRNSPASGPRCKPLRTQHLQLSPVCERYSTAMATWSRCFARCVMRPGRRRRCIRWRQDFRR
jgi:hypothetical protein